MNVHLRAVYPHRVTAGSVVNGEAALDSDISTVHERRGLEYTYLSNILCCSVYPIVFEVHVLLTHKVHLLVAHPF
jgi:hypothetical protein